MTKTFMFIGFSFTDPNFSYICAHLRAHLKGNMREHYCFLKDVSETDYPDRDQFEYKKRKLSYFIDDLKRFNIKTVLIKEYSEITEILQSIKRNIIVEPCIYLGQQRNMSLMVKRRMKNL